MSCLFIDHTMICIPPIQGKRPISSPNALLNEMTTICCCICCVHHCHHQTEITIQKASHDNDTDSQSLQSRDQLPIANFLMSLLYLEVVGGENTTCRMLTLSAENHDHMHDQHILHLTGGLLVFASAYQQPVTRILHHHASILTLISRTLHAYFWLQSNCICIGVRSINVLFVSQMTDIFISLLYLCVCVCGGQSVLSVNCLITLFGYLLSLLVRGGAVLITMGGHW